MNRWLKDDTTTDVEDDLPPPLKPAQLKVLAKLPEGRVNETIHELFVKPAKIEMPANPAVEREWWTAKRPELSIRANRIGIRSVALARHAPRRVGSPECAESIGRTASSGACSIA